MPNYFSNEDLSHAVDLEVIKIGTDVPSETTQTRDRFRTKLLERDTCCVWSGSDPDGGVGLHIIPYQRGSDVRSTILCWDDISSFHHSLKQWFRLIKTNRPNSEEDVAQLDDINDIRNGVFANVSVCTYFDRRRVVILKVCHVPVCRLSDPCAPYFRLQTKSFTPMTFPHATFDNLCRKVSVIRTMIVIRCNG